MVLLMTDAEFHYALDDKLAGIVTPNDLQCRMSQARDEGARQQFPSYAQIVRTVLEVSWLFVCLFVCLVICLFVYLFICLFSVSLKVSSSFFLRVTAGFSLSNRTYS